ncbi:acid protease [Aureobasidium pullulans]|nr:acid protease [Aureobasidium pullulans]
MKKSGFVTLFLSALSLLAEATGSESYDFQTLSTAGRALAGNGTVEIDLNGKYVTENGMAYFLDILVGTPGQMQSVMIDTGSSDLIVTASNASACITIWGCAGGTFDPVKSSTFGTVTPDGLSITYGDYSRKVGDYVNDVTQIGDVPMTDAQLGLAYYTKDFTGFNFGIMGLGYSSNLAGNEAVEPDEQSYPPTFIETLVHTGVIASRLFSLHLNELGKRGSIIFGGIDVDKFRGPLTTLNCLADNDTVKDFYLNLEEVTVQSSKGGSQSLMRPTGQKPYPVLLDTGSLNWNVPTDVYEKITEAAGAFEANDTKTEREWLEKPCDDLDRGGIDAPHIQLTLSGNGSNTVTLDLEMADLFIPRLNQDGSAKTNDVGQALCELIVSDYGSPKDLDQEGGIAIGNVVTRTGYFVFDLDNGQISIAQADFAANSSNVVQVEAGPDGLKNAFDGLKAEHQTNHVEGQFGR